MRLLIACLAALCAVALATPSIAQDSEPTPAPAAKPKPGTKAYCNTLKKATTRNACLKKLHASTAKTKTKSKTKAKKPAKTDAAEAPMTPPTAPAAAPSQGPSPPLTITVPPLPSKTI